MSIQPIILAAGKGTRMKSELPKALVPFCNKPLIHHVFGAVLALEGLKKPITVIGHMGEKVQESLGERSLYVIQKEQLGTGHAVQCALPSVDSDYVLVLYADMPLITAQDIQKIIDTHSSHQTMSHKVSVMMVTSTVDDFENERKNLERYGRVVRENGKVKAIVEYKDATEEIRNIKEVNPSYFLFETAWLRNAITLITSQNAQNEYYLTDLVKIAIEHGRCVETVPFHYKSVLGANSLEELEILEKIVSQN